MTNFKKERYNPLDIIADFWPDANIEHITYDPDLSKGEYNIIRQSGSDGTLLFTLQMIENGLINIVNKVSYCKATEPEDWSKVKDIKYTVGKMRHATVYGEISLKCSKNHKYPGQKERIRMPVIVEYVY